MTRHSTGPLAHALMLLTAMLLGACQKSSEEGAAPAAETAASTEDSAAPERTVLLAAEDAQHMGITTSPAGAASYAPETPGYGVVMAHEPIAQAVADVAVAEAATRQSRATLARVQRLAGTPGAYGPDTLEAAEHQAAIDTAALTLSKRKLSALLGADSPLQGGDAGVLGDVANGQAKIVRVSFPLGAARGDAPHSLRMARLDSTGRSDSWSSTTVWDAPADPNMPGRSLFALLQNASISEGERLQVWKAGGSSTAGIAIPSSAVVVKDGTYWCYVEKPAGTFTRVAIDASRPLADGYFVREGVAAGDKIVTAAAGLLLAREINPSTEAE
ncbi:MAG: hypothetical protein ABIQ86_00040 [Steroidobacteraceae bacterium]